MPFLAVQVVDIGTGVVDSESASSASIGRAIQFKRAPAPYKGPPPTVGLNKILVRSVVSVMPIKVPPAVPAKVLAVLALVSASVEPTVEPPVQPTVSGVIVVSVATCPKPTGSTGTVAPIVQSTTARLDAVVSVFWARANPLQQQQWQLRKCSQ